MTIWTTKPISDEPILPSTVAPDKSIQQFALRMCRGTREAASICIRTSKPLVGFTVSIKALSKARDGPSVDCRYVLRWWQGGKDTKHTSPVFVPELLVKDPLLVFPDHGNQRNVVRHPVEDAKTLQPMYLPNDYTQQMWLTLHVPQDCLPGGYTYKVSVISNDQIIASIPLSIDVLSFDLVEPDFTASLFYRGKIDPEKADTPNPEWKTLKQYKAEMVNIADHGITHPTSYEDWSSPYLEDVIKIRASAGLAIDPFYNIDLKTDLHLDDPLAIAQLQNSILRFRLRLLEYGVKNLFIYGDDEKSAEELKSQQAAWDAVIETGTKIFVACREDALEIMGKKLAQPIMVPTRAHSSTGQFWSDDFGMIRNKKWNELGIKPWLYASPQTTGHNPEEYRCNYGLRAYTHGYGGICPYTYQGGREIWDDFASKVWRDHVLAYPTISGLVDTVQWEGLRTGLNDVKYAATLKQMGGTIPAIDAREDLYLIRENMIDEILAKI